MRSSEGLGIGATVGAGRGVCAGATTRGRGEGRGEGREAAFVRATGAFGFRRTVFVDDLDLARAVERPSRVRAGFLIAFARADRVGFGRRALARARGRRGFFALTDFRLGRLEAFARATGRRVLALAMVVSFRPR